MNDKRGNDKRGPKKFGQGRDSGGRGDREVTMHKATCAECKRNCEVPFKPTGSKPILCKDCYGETRSNAEPREFKKSRPDPKFDDVPRLHERQLKNIESEIASLHLKVDSITRNLQRLVSEIAKADTSTLKDIMSEVGVIDDDK